MNSVETKFCKRCSQHKSIDEFGRRSVTKDGLSFYCRVCWAEYNNAAYHQNPVYMKMYNEAYREKNAEILENKRIVKLYGITSEDLEKIIQKQDNKCAICGKPFEKKILHGRDKNKRPHVDHDHDLNFVRGILCSCCNTAIGLLQEDPRIVRLAAKYLEEANASFNNR